MHERDGMTFKENRTQYISHLSERVSVGDVSRVHEKNMRKWHVLNARGEVFCSHPVAYKRIAVACKRNSLRIRCWIPHSVTHWFPNACKKQNSDQNKKNSNVQESCKMTEDTYSCHSRHPCSSCHSGSCGSYHALGCHRSVEDEEEACDQLFVTLQFQLCHSRSDRTLSSIGRCRSRRCFGM